MNTSEPNQDLWADCPRGTLAHLRPTGRSNRRLGPFPAGVIVGTLACLLFAAFSVFFYSTESPPAATQRLLTCAEVLPLLGDYKAATVTPETSSRIAAHLAKCEMCRTKFEQLAAERSLGDVWVASSIDQQRAPLRVAQLGFASVN